MTTTADNRDDTDLSEFINFVNAGPTPHTIIIDASTVMKKWQHCTRNG
jgi:hypothetical protein